MLRDFTKSIKDKHWMDKERQLNKIQGRSQINSSLCKQNGVVETKPVSMGW